MLTETKIVFTKKYIFRITYKLTVRKGGFFIKTESEKFEKKAFLSCKNVLPEKTESKTEKLPKMGWRQAKALFDEVSANLILPERFLNITKTEEADCDEFMPVS